MKVWYSPAELEAIADRIGDDVDTLEAEGLLITTFRVGRFRVQVGLGTLDQEAHGHAQRVLRARYGPVRVLPGRIEVHAAEGV